MEGVANNETDVHLKIGVWGAASPMAPCSSAPGLHKRMTSIDISIKYFTLH